MLLLSLLVFAASTPAALSAETSGIFVGNLRTRQHNTKGAVYAVDEKTLVVRHFEYDGTAPDAFFWVGASGSTPNLNGTILPYPFAGKFYDYNDKVSILSILIPALIFRLILYSRISDEKSSSTKHNIHTCVVCRYGVLKAQNPTY
jgi:hypothetical protein